MDGNDLTVWLASERQLFRFSLLGELVARESLDPALAQLVTRTSASKVRLNSVVGSSDGGLIAAAQLQPNEKNARDAFALVKFSPDGKSATLLTLPSIEHGQGSLIGDEPDGKLVFLEKSGWEFDVTYRELDKRRPPE